MNALNWEKLNNSSFQRLVNDLISLEVGKPGYIPGSPDIGPDGGLDGRYEGEYMGLNGKWSIQAKYTKYNLDEAYNHLCSELVNELKKAQKGGFDYLIFATNAELRIGEKDISKKQQLKAHVGELEKLNTRHVKKLFIFHREKLREIIARQPYIAHAYFNYPQHPMFVPANVYAQNIEKKLLLGDAIGRDDELKSFQDFISSDKRLLLIHTFGGNGKSHFLINATKEIDKMNSKYIPMYCRPRMRNFGDAINSELVKNNKYCLILDDAERNIEEAKNLIAFSGAVKAEDIKIILSCRTAGLEIIKNELLKQEIDFSENELGILSYDDLQELLFRSAETRDIKHPDRIIEELNSIPYLIVETGKMIKGGADPTSIKNKIVINLVEDSKRALGGVMDNNIIKEFLRDLSVVIPFQRGINNTTSKLLEVYGLDENKFNKIISTLEKTKILRYIGNSIRFNPDMVGDIFLSKIIDESNNEEITGDILDNWLEVCPERVTSNIASAMRHSDSKKANEAIKKLISKYINEIEETSNQKRIDNLKTISHVAYLAPEESLNLLYTYIDAPQNKMKDENDIVNDEIFKISRDDFGPIISQLCYLDNYKKEVIDFIRFISEKNIKGTYNNYEPSTLIRKLVSPIKMNSHKKTMSAMAVLEKLADEDGVSEMDGQIITEALKEVLSGSHEYTETYKNKMTFSKKKIIYNNTYEKLRESALKILIKLIEHKNKNISIIGIDVVDDIGRDGDPNDVDYKNRFIYEKKKTLVSIQKLNNTKTNISVLSKIEDVLIRLWAISDKYPEISEIAEEELKKLPRSEEYIIYRFYTANDIIVIDFNDLLRDDPKKDRWSWLVHNHFRLHRKKPNKIDEIVQNISEKYKTSEEVKKMLKKIDQEVGANAQWQYVPLVESWVQFNKEVFLDFVKKDVLLSDIPNRFHLGIYRITADNDPKFAETYANKIIDNVSLKNIERIDILIDLVQRVGVPIEKYLEWICKILKVAETNEKSIILHRSFFVFKDLDLNAKQGVVKILETAIEEGANSQVLDNFNFLFRSAVEWGVDFEKEVQLKENLYKIICDIDEIDYQVDDLLNFVIGDDISRFLDFIEYRLKKSHLTSYRKRGNFRAIPFNGFKSTDSLIKSYSDFELLMDKLNYFRKKELLYSFQTKDFLKNFVITDDDEQNYLEKYISEKIAEGSKDSIALAINSLYGLYFGNDTYKIFLSLLQEADKIGLFDDAKEVFYHRVLSGGYSSSVGEVPPALKNKKETLEKMREESKPGKIMTFINNLIQSIEDDIKRHLERDEEEVLNPKN